MAETKEQHKCRAKKPHPCEDCEEPTTNHIPCPYDQDLHGDQTLHWLCDGCADTRAREI